MVQAQYAAPAPLSVDEDVLRSKVEEVEASTSLDEEAQAALLQLYRRALTDLEQARADDGQTELFEDARKNAGPQTEKLRRQYQKESKLDPGQSLRVSQRTPVEELEQALGKER
ncbi:MAG: hypothetical protein ACU85V_18305, partial [Gammaproteobacteria bacterium]